ncbi:hypothetical protein BMS3Bbin04_00408 [bacterium BMS3Bbin04]|nr:hypothetical protein BMS3Bbin04_00408 [bacterium BMS3Bbin04]
MSNRFETLDPQSFCGWVLNVYRDRVLATVEYDDGLIATHFHQFSGLKSFEETHISLSFDTLRLRMHGWIPLSADVHALVDPASLTVLRSLPNCRLIELCEGQSQTFRATGVQRPATPEVFGSFRMEKDKETVYADCVRISLLDVMKVVATVNVNFGSLWKQEWRQ